jgi:hypothetical protein
MAEQTGMDTRMVRKGTLQVKKERSVFYPAPAREVALPICRPAPLSGQGTGWSLAAKRYGGLCAHRAIRRRYRHPRGALACSTTPDAPVANWSRMRCARPAEPTALLCSGTARVDVAQLALVVAELGRVSDFAPSQQGGRAASSTPRVPAVGVDDSSAQPGSAYGSLRRTTWQLDRPGGLR